jgi:Tol biopolymer transport system component
VHFFPAWSANGDSLYYIDHGVIGLSQGGGYVVDPDSAGLAIVARDGGHQRMVLNLPGYFTYDISPDGTAACLAINSELVIGVFQSGKLDQGTFAQVANISAANPKWDRSGEWLVFDSNENDPHGAQAVWKVRLDGSELTDISIHSQGEWLQPAWSANGTKIVYVRYVSDTPMSEIFTMNADGSGNTRLTRNGVMDIDPEFSPDGSKIVYESWVQGVQQIWGMKSDGSARRRVVDGSMPALSPDGSEIAFIAQTSDPKTNGTVWIVRIDGSQSHQVTTSRLVASVP